MPKGRSGRGIPRQRQEREARQHDAKNRNSDGSTWRDHMERQRTDNEKRARFDLEQLREQEQKRIDKANREAEVGRRKAERERVNRNARERDQQRRAQMEQDRQRERDRAAAQQRHAEEMARRYRDQR